LTSTDVELADGETLVDEATELVYRQVTAFLIDNGKVATHAFTGPRSEGGMPSYARSSLVTAQDSRDWHTSHANSPSVGVWALQVSEVVLAGSHVTDDSRRQPRDGEMQAPGHCYVNARGLDRLALKELRAKLWQAAMNRGEVPTHEPLKDGELDLGL
jgi:hypothetical protein